MKTFISILFIIVSAIIILGIFSILNRFILRKIKVNKWIILVAAVITFILPIILRLNILWQQYFFSGLFAILLLWFFDVHQNKGQKKEKKMVIKPKAKPNRVKHLNKK